MRIAIALTVLCFSAGLLRAEPPQIAVEALSETQAGDAADRAVVGGKEASLALAIEAPLGTKLDLIADLLQLAHSIAAPLQKDLPLATALAFEDRTRQVVHVSIPVPEVKHVTRMLVRFRTQVAGAGEWKAAGQTRLAVYPADHLREFKELLSAQEKERGIRLAVFGEHGGVRDFLRAERIDFEDLGAEFPADLSASFVYLGSANTGKQPVRIPTETKARMVLFDLASDLLPGVYRGPRRTAYVTLPLLDHLTTDPKNQATFARIVSELLAEPSPDHP